MIERIDKVLVLKNIFSSRSKAQEAVREGLVFCDGKKILKNNQLVPIDGDVRVDETGSVYVSRAGAKLEKAIKEFGIELQDKVVLDIGSSTGGFVDCALQNGAKKVIAVDVGTDQLDISLRENFKVELYEETDFREINNDLVEKADIVTIDVSFISLILLLDKIKSINNVKEIICLIKPQFECGREVADKYKGIILNKEAHLKVLTKIIRSFKNIGFNIQNITFSPKQGRSGNIEYLAYFTKDNVNYVNITEQIDKAFKNYNIINK